MTDPAEVERHLLPRKENERIVPDLLQGRASQEMPTVVFLVGQPGAGRSRVTEMVAAQLDRHGGFVDVDSDLYKPYHPAYAELMAQDDTLMAAYTRATGEPGWRRPNSTSATAGPCRRCPARTARPSSAAAHSRSTTMGKRPSTSGGAKPSERSSTEGYQLPGPEQRRGPSR
ncbi:hypothetical protein GCM10010293_68580 [Streptomyces griseoflavus]|uniref:zeta toxin family protein n=1 Tax=Streptomyces griseoflavus TaxID=35619 RepID=UPI00199AABF9|nr:zeta toxin family protein [Streptomyces griseoflavus]GGV54580.1 hypothetical protein GCM10010293_68580 [Streptomyces griseoflavus]